MAQAQPIPRGEEPTPDTFEGRVETQIAELISLLNEQNAVTAELRRRVLRPERGAGRGLIHPGDLAGGFGYDVA